MLRRGCGRGQRFPRSVGEPRHTSRVSDFPHRESRLRRMFTLHSSLTRSHAALRGILALALGLVFLIWPGVTIGVAVALFAIFCFVDAIIASARLFSSGRSTGDRILQVLRMVVDVAAALVAIAYPGPTTEVLTVIIGVYAIVVGILYLAAYGAILLVSAAMAPGDKTVSSPVG